LAGRYCLVGLGWKALPSFSWLEIIALWILVEMYFLVGLGFKVLPGMSWLEGISL
jgi:hypothetical protein